MTNCTRGLFSTLLCHNIGSRGLGEGEGGEPGGWGGRGRETRGLGGEGEGDPGAGGGGRRIKGEGQSLAKRSGMLVIFVSPF